MENKTELTPEQIETIVNHKRDVVKFDICGDTSPKPLLSIYRIKLEDGLSQCDVYCAEFAEKRIGGLKIKILLREGIQWKEAACIEKKEREVAAVPLTA